MGKATAPSRRSGESCGRHSRWQWMTMSCIKNPFGFELATVVVNDSVTREAVTKEQMRKFLKFVHDDNVYCKYYEVVYILFHTGLRISEFCGLTLRDIDLENNILNIDHQIQRTANMKLVIESTKTNAGTRKWQCTGSIVSIIWSNGTMRFTGCRCRTSRPMSAVIPTAATWQSRV